VGPVQRPLLGETPSLVEEPVERDNEPIKAVPIDPPVKRSVAIIDPTMVAISWCVQCQKILVRSEYKEAGKAALLANEADTDVFLVCGQPGIGVFPSPPIDITCRI